MRRRLGLAYDAGTLPDDATITGGARIPYYRALDAIDPVAAALALGKPILVLHGGRDYHISTKDYARWRAGLAGRPWGTVKGYPDLNHLFAPGVGRSTPEEYVEPKNVDPRVIEDLAVWILGGGKLSYTPDR